MTTSPPASQAAKISVGVYAPGMQAILYLLHMRTISSFSTGLTTNFAPAIIAMRAVSASSTLPTPMMALSPNLALACAMVSNAPGEVIVISSALTPPSLSATVVSINSSALLTLITATTPVSSIVRKHFSLSITDPSFYHSAALTPYLPPYSHNNPDNAQTLLDNAGDIRRAADRYV